MKFWYTKNENSASMTPHEFTARVEVIDQVALKELYDWCEQHYTPGHYFGFNVREVHYRYYRTQDDGTSWAAAKQIEPDDYEVFLSTSDDDFVVHFKLRWM